MSGNWGSYGGSDMLTNGHLPLRISRSFPPSHHLSFRGPQTQAIHSFQARVHCGFNTVLFSYARGQLNVPAFLMLRAYSRFRNQGALHSLAVGTAVYRPHPRPRPRPLSRGLPGHSISLNQLNASMLHQMLGHIHPPPGSEQPRSNEAMNYQNTISSSSWPTGNQEYAGNTIFNAVDWHAGTAAMHHDYEGAPPFSSHLPVQPIDHLAGQDMHAQQLLPDGNLDSLQQAVASALPGYSWSEQLPQPSTTTAQTQNGNELHTYHQLMQAVQHGHDTMLLQHPQSQMQQHSYSSESDDVDAMTTPEHVLLSHPPPIGDASSPSTRFEEQQQQQQPQQQQQQQRRQSSNRVSLLSQCAIHRERQLG
jgi:hypothetical protein